MYYPFFLAYILTGVLIGAAVFVWALKSGQFKDQQRARFLALEDVPSHIVAPSFKARFEIYFILSIAVAAIVASFALVGYALFFA
ncbi:MAG: cbb3-type cytochrome oxidase assembly protein CcoS [Desulfobacula sp.]|jgi:cbb3-type cytochrome oxidase maturation protein|nr:cbb3-type cytochrome oxidase assembly protein CcoS [Desulfobacula sp.]